MPLPPRVVCLGAAVLDRIFEVETIPSEPVKVLAHAFRERGGGMAATAAVAVAALGGRAELWGRLGCDATGDALAAEMDTRGVDLSHVRRSRDGRTPTAAVIVDRSGERLIAGFGGHGLDDAETGWLPLERLNGAGALLCDCRWFEGAEAAFAAAAARAVPTVLDADLAPPERLAPLVAGCDYALFSERGLNAFVGRQPASEALEIVAARTRALVGVTLGRGGFLWRESGTEQRLASYPVAVHDTTGAGDTFHGAFALAIAEGRPSRDAALFASAAAALKCRNGEGWAGMPSRRDIENLQQETTHAALSR